MPHWKTLFPRDFLAAFDLQDAAGKPRDAVCTIASVDPGEISERPGSSAKKRAGFVTFVGKKLKLILNKTNSETIAKMYGDDYLAWAGKRVSLYADVTNVGPKKNIPCVRVRPRPPADKAPDATLASDAPPTYVADMTERQALEGAA